MFLCVLKAAEQLLHDGIEVGDQLNTFTARCRQTDDTQVGLQILASQDSHAS